MLNDSGKDPQDNKFYDLGKLKDIGCFNILTILGTGKIKIKIRSVAIYRTTTVMMDDCNDGDSDDMKQRMMLYNTCAVLLLMKT